MAGSGRLSTVRAIKRQVIGLRLEYAPIIKLPKLTQYTPTGLSSLSPRSLTSNLTNTKSRIPPTRSNGIDISCCHIGLNPLLLMTCVRIETVRADEARPICAWARFFDGEYDESRPPPDDDAGASGSTGARDQSGTWSVTSTNGSMTDLVCSSRPSRSFGRGSC